jgi:hypothetical protein
MHIMPGELETWRYVTSNDLLFCNEWDDNRQWAGALDGVSIYNRYRDPSEAAKKYEWFQGK